MNVKREEAIRRVTGKSPSKGSLTDVTRNAGTLRRLDMAKTSKTKATRRMKLVVLLLVSREH